MAAAALSYLFNLLRSSILFQKLEISERSEMNYIFLLFLELTTLNVQKTTVLFNTEKFGKMCLGFEEQRKILTRKRRDMTVGKIKKLKEHKWSKFRGQLIPVARFFSLDAC
tara:strand:+ start:399 stop:731 length:333 start_codon:yes stop_codon:yes gene_type:complete